MFDHFQRAHTSLANINCQVKKEKYICMYVLSSGFFITTSNFSCKLYIQYSSIFEIEEKAALIKLNQGLCADN